MTYDRLSTTQKGFTLIELLITFAVVGVLAAVSTVSFVTYNQSQSLTNAGRDIAQMMALAKSRAQSQVKPADCAGSLSSYIFRTCSPSLPCLASGGDYEVVVACKNASGANIFIASSPAAGAPAKKLPSGISFTEASKGKSFEFKVLTGGVTNASSLVLVGPNNSQKTITIDSQGNIDEE